jgi:hypothetical protein
LNWANIFRKNMNKAKKHKVGNPKKEKVFCGFGLTNISATSA